MTKKFAFLADIQYQVGQSLQEVMEGFDRTAIHTQGSGFAVVVDDRGRCVGVVTDGDIRRALVTGVSMKAPVRDAMTRDFVFVRPDESPHQILRLFDHRVRHLPVIDSDGCLADLLQFNAFDASTRAERNIIRARAPVRISLAGGGTDMTFYFRNRTGYVLSSTINKYCYASVSVRPDQRVRLISKDYDQTFEAESLDGLKYGDRLDLIKACVKVMAPSFGFDLETYSEVEPGTGLGGSAAVSSAVIGVLNHLRNEDRLDRYHLADLAYQAERIELGVSGGWQDQYAAVFGGLNLIEFRKDEIIVFPLRIPEDILLELHFNLLLFRFGKARESGKIAGDQQQRFNTSEASMVREYDALAGLTLRMKDELLKGALNRFGTLLDDAWQIKKTFSDKISSPEIDELYNAARRSGALGGKVLGAGGGGYLMFYCAPSHQTDVIDALHALGARQDQFDFVETGLQTWTTKQSGN